MSSDVPELAASAAPVPAPRRVVIAALAGGLLAALLSGGAGELLRDWFQPHRVGNPADPMLVQFDAAELNRTSVKNAALVFGAQGLVLGGVLGLAGGAARPSSRAGLVAGLVGAPAGAILGAAAAFGAFTAYFDQSDGGGGELAPSILAHAVAWAALGAAGGLAFGVGLGGRGRIVRAAVGGLLGACVGALLYDVGGSIALPLDKTGEPLAATTAARLLAHGLTGLAAALGAALFANTPP